MKVFKFGGASVSSVERIKNVAAILETYKDEKLVVIISAMGKTTNALEKVAEAFFAGKQDDALKLFNLVKQNHLTTAKYLLVKSYNKTLEELVNYFTEVEWLLHDKPVRDYDYYYDQIVCIGEMLSTCLMSAYLNEVGVNNQLVDVRDLLRTDDNFRDAGVDWKVSKLAIDNLVLAEEKTLRADTNTPGDKQRKTISNQPNIIITQGFIGSTDANESTTLGREGSDYSAAIFANILDAESLTIWKDVEGVMSADPKEFKDATYLEALSYFEVIEMAYYGAQVIHPKTIKPLQNKQIPLYVKSFINPQLPGTVISKKNGKNLPPIKIVKPNQVIVFLSSQDFSFVGEEPMSKLYQIFNSLHIKPNLIQTGAINIQICVDDHAEKIDQLAAAASELFHVQIERGLSLLTIRHYTEDVLQSMIAGKQVELVQKTPSTVQVLYKN